MKTRGKMKNIKLYLLAGALAFSSVGCQKELEEKFQDPSKYTPEGNVVPGMFSNMMSRTRTFKNDYGEFWHQAGTPGGILGNMQLMGRYFRDQYTYFDGFNDMAANASRGGLDAYFNEAQDFRELPQMEIQFDGMSDRDKNDSEIYITISKMVRGYRATKGVDMYNSIPYSEALKAHEGVFFPKFDDPWEIYQSVLNELKEGAAKLDAQYEQLSSDGVNTFAKQDIIFQGDVQKWKSWAAAMRLRLAVRVSGVYQSEAEAIIAEVLASGQLPASDLLISNAMWISKDKDHWKRGFSERDYTAFVTPPVMYAMDRDADHDYTEGIDDPRLPVFALPQKQMKYIPASFHSNVAQEVYNQIGGYAFYVFFDNVAPYLEKNSVSLWNPATFARNNEEVRAFTRAEVDLLLAEVALKGMGNTGKTPEQHVKDAFINSTKYWYKVNSETVWGDVNVDNAYFLTPTLPSDSALDQYGNTLVADMTAAGDIEDKMEIIMRQKQLHLNMHDYVEVFTETRRTRHPKQGLMLYEPTNYIVKPVIERYPYPSSVVSTNPEKYNEVAEQDNFTSHIFWVPQEKRSEDYYETELNDRYMYTEVPGVAESFKD